MRKLVWLLLAITLAAVVIAGRMVGGRVQRMRRVTVRVDVTKVEKDLRDHLNVGASRTEVEAYLDKRRIHHSYIENSPSVPEYTRTEQAMIPDSSRSWLATGDIQIVFSFDEKDKLTHYSVKEVFTGP